MGRGFVVSAKLRVPASIASQFLYTGRMRYELRIMEGKFYHVLIFETSGTLQVYGTYTGDICLIGGGAAGSTYGRGGGGGYVTNVFNRALVNGAIVIGAGSGSMDNAGGTTTYTGLSAAGGAINNYSNVNHGKGGCGGGGGVEDGTAAAPGAGQHTTTRPFASLDLPPQAGGGAGRVSGNGTAGNGGSDGSDGTAWVNSGAKPLGDPGLYGGGVGYCPSSHYAMLAYGGGGGASTGSYDSAGYPGAVMFRIAA